MQGVLYEETSVVYFLFATMLMGGWGAWMTGRAMASTWRSPRILVLYLLVLGVAIRFIHHALFEGSFLTFRYYAVDTLYLLAVGLLGYRVTRARMMVAQYGWIYERNGALGWKRKDGVAA